MDTSLNNEIVAGLDIGATKVVAFIGRKNRYGRIEILGLGKSEITDFNRGVVDNTDKVIESIKNAVNHAETISQVKIKHLYVNISGRHIRNYNHCCEITRDNVDVAISLQDVNLLIEKMLNLVLPPGEDIINAILQDFFVDNESGIRDPVGASGISLGVNFNILTGMVKAANNIHRCVAKSGMQVENLILGQLASAEAVLHEDEKEAGVALVDIGGNTTEIAIFNDGIIRYTAVIPLGGDIITEDIKESYSILQNQAEALKIKFGSALCRECNNEEFFSVPGLEGTLPKDITMKNLAAIIQYRIEEIIEQIYWEIRNSGFERKLIAGIVLTGGGSQLKNLQKLTEFITGINVRIGYPDERLAGNISDELHSPMYATGIGLVILGIKNIEIQNIFGNEFQRKSMILFHEDFYNRGKNVYFLRRRKKTFLERILSGRWN